MGGCLWLPVSSRNRSSLFLLGTYLWSVSSTLQVQDVCLPDGTYWLSVSDGAAPSELGWSVCDQDGTGSLSLASIQITKPTCVYTDLSPTPMPTPVPSSSPCSSPTGDPTVTPTRAPSSSPSVPYR